ncbi:hypothetical protein [uncultured Deinococcus sp.]|uniref:hypothetical protein n=1 Tax=uncultured Deinococcus sp. TaxID=158789 RepID=UPI0025DF16A3|nr:hypothetical protein [uncultured Deinococcus sp.]
MTALAHAAVLTVTGWPRRVGPHLVVGGLPIATPAEPPADARVTVRAWPRVSATAGLKGLSALRGNVRPASGPNGTHLLVIGHLLNLDPVDGLMRLEVCPRVSTTRPFVVTLHATTQILQAIDPAQVGVRVTGRVLSGRVPLLLAETAEAVYAPVPGRWHGWHGRRRVAPAPLERVLNEAAD